ncbi:MAG: hypothetical protein FWG58_00430 [Methanomassiliicoccaceae archaeon]|nr:hypothetical protein [Methanomassiliicoccaceae archaeon]
MSSILPKGYLKPMDQNGDKKTEWPIPSIVDEKEYEEAILRLQNEVGLEFREARAVLLPSQFIEDIMDEWNISYEEFCELSLRGIAKVEKYTGNDPEKNEELMPTRMSYIM